MKITYIVELDDEVLGYFGRLSSAKWLAKEYNSAIITKLIGPYFGEGFHAYRLYWNGQKFSYKYKQRG